LGVAGITFTADCPYFAAESETADVSDEYSIEEDAALAQEGNLQ